MPEHRPTRRVFDSPGIYRIRVTGCLGESWSDALGGMTIETSAISDGTISDGTIGDGTIGDGECVTTLTGLLLDQAALAGVLNNLRELRLRLISVERVETAPAAGAGRKPAEPGAAGEGITAE